MTAEAVSSRTLTNNSSGKCAGQEEILEGSGLQVRGRVNGDLDSDGTSDEALVVADYAAPERCRFFLVAKLTSRPAVVVALDQGVAGADADTAAQIPWPRLYALVNVEGRSEAEIVVVLDQGASTAFIGLFRVRSARLERLRIHLRGLRDLFSVGSGRLATRVDCAQRRGADVIYAEAFRDRDRWIVKRRFFSLSGSGFVLQPG